MTDRFDLPPERPSRLAWWLHPKVALPLTLLMLLVLAPFLYRGYRIASVPDIGDPFDVAAFEAVEIASGDNAVDVYANANAMRRSLSYRPEDLEDVFQNGWGAATEPIRKWLADNEPALDDWRRGTERPTALHVPVKDLRIDMSMSLVQDLREFARLARARAERCLHDGDVTEAWEWLRATVRSSRHLGQRGVAIERLVGIGVFFETAVGINRWAADPRVDDRLLRRAAEQLEEVDAMTPLPSIALKCEYVMFLQTLESNRPWEALGMPPASTRIPAGALSSLLFVRGEPEVSRRITQHVFAGWLEQADLPRWNRAPKAASFLGLRATPPKPGRLTASELEAHVVSFSIARFLLPALSHVEEAVDRESAHRAALRLVLAAQRYRRQHEDWPAKLEDLVPEFIDPLPGDPFGKSGETLRLKHESDDLLIYSLGPNELDDGGNLLYTTGIGKPDEGIRLTRPK